MEVLRSSVTARLFFLVCLTLRQWYDASALGGLGRMFAAFARRLSGGSACVRIVTRPGVLSRAWRRSSAFALLSLLLNLPAALLHWVYRRFWPVFDGSAAARLAFGMGAQVPVAAGWLMLLFLCIPYRYWDNRYSLLGFAALFLLLVAGGMARRTLRVDLAAIGPYLVLFAVSQCLAWPLSAFPHLSLRYLFFHIACMLCVLVVVSSVARADQLLRLVYCSAGGLSVAAAYGVVQRMQGIEVNPSWVDMTLHADMPGRVFSFFQNPNSFAHVLVLLIPLSVALVLGSPTLLGRLLGLAGAGLGGAALLMTYSRASWLGLAAAAFVFLLLWKPRLIPFVCLAALAALPVLPDSVFNRLLTIFNLSDTSTASRFPLYQAALRLLGARPLLGAGLGADAVRKAVADLNLYHGYSPFVHAHNVYLQIWAESGLLGAVSFLGTMGWTAKRAVSAAAKPGCPSAVRLIVIGGVSALAGLLVCGLADFIWTYPRVMLVFWFVVALTLAGAKVALPLYKPPTPPLQQKGAPPDEY